MATSCDHHCIFTIIEVWFPQTRTVQGQNSQFIAQSLAIPGSGGQFFVLEQSMDSLDHLDLIVAVVHEQSLNGPWTVPWWSTDSHWPSVDSPWLNVEKGFFFAPLPSMNNTWNCPWTVLWQSGDCPSCPVTDSGPLPQSTYVLRMTRINGSCSQDNALYFYIHSCTLHHPHSLHSDFFIEISTWPTWTMLCFKCRNHIYDMYHEVKILRYLSTL